MAIKKYSSGAWVTAKYRKYCTETDTITSLPAQIIGDGQTITSCQVSGNTLQDGTPSPEAPVDVIGCGVRTGNLFDVTTVEKGRINDGNVVYQSNTTSLTIEGDTVTYTTNARYRGVCSGFIEIPDGAEYLCWSGVFSGGDGIAKRIIYYDSTKTWLNADSSTTSSENSGRKQIPVNAKYVRFSFTSQGIGEASISNMMVSAGYNDLPYEPYGYKLPLIVNGTEYPIYLGQVETTRMVKKLVLTGNETVYIESGIFDIRVSDFKVPISPYFAEYCNFYISGIDYSSVRNNNLVFAVTTSRILIHDNSFSNVTDFKTYLTTKYAAGTPVTIWYVLATPETGIVNEPLMKIGNYADTVTASNIPTTGIPETFDVGTTLKPSEVQLTYHGWHEHTDTKYTQGE